MTMLIGRWHPPTSRHASATSRKASNRQRAALAEGRFNDANMILLQKINPGYTEAAKRADDLYRYQIEQGQRQLDSATASYSSIRNWVLMLFAAALLAGVVIAMRIIKTVTGPLTDIQQTFQSLSEGNYT